MSAGSERPELSSRGQSLSTEDWHLWWEEAGGWQLRQLLFWRWDPIRVSDDFPFTHGEYDRYAGHLEKLLADGAGPPELSAYLLEVEKNEMGLTRLEEPSKEHKEVADLILHWYGNSLAHWRLQIR